MSRFLYRNLELLEPYEGKLSCTVLRGESSRKGADLPDQQIEKGFSMYVYDFKFSDLSTIAYNHLLNHPEGYKVKPKFYVINFDDPRRSHRCNPIHPDFMEDITDAYESAYTIMLNLNKTWVQKQGDFFVESPIILFASIIWYLKIYQNGKYCTFPHAIEFLNRRYEDIFPILTSYPELENYLSPFMDAWLGGAAEQLMGQIASAKIPLSRMISPQLYWVMSARTGWSRWRTSWRTAFWQATASARPDRSTMRPRHRMAVRSSSARFSARMNSARTAS